MIYENLEQLSADNDIDIVEMPLRGKIKGLYSDSIIALSNQIDTMTEKACILAEELGHYHTTAGNILDQSKIENRKQEHRARRWAVKRLVRVEDFIRAFEARVTSKAELAEFLDITEKFLDMAIDHFVGIYGQYYKSDDYIISFDPLWVLKRTDKGSE